MLAGSRELVLEDDHETAFTVDDDCGGGDLRLCVAGSLGKLLPLCDGSTRDGGRENWQVDGNGWSDGDGLGRASGCGGWRRGNAKRWRGAEWSWRRLWRWRQRWSQHQR